PSRRPRIATVRTVVPFIVNLLLAKTELDRTAAAREPGWVRARSNLLSAIARQFRQAAVFQS
ncbi:MAG: hypothetical protein ACPHTD_11470, partial [Gammaproteobacteria bacterium]